MFDLETAISTWRHVLKNDRALFEEDLDELEQHLRDQIPWLMNKGLSEEEAFRRAIRDMGEIGSIQHAYQRVFWQKAKHRRTLKDELTWRAAMLKNYLIIAGRNLRKQKSYAFINIVSLSIGIAFCSLIFLFVRDELTYDRFHEFADRIHMVEGVVLNPDGGIDFSFDAHPLPLGPTLKSDIPEVEEFVRIGEGEHFVRSNGEAIQEPILYVDPQFFSVFSFPLIDGQASTALTDRSEIVISLDAANKYFGSTDVVGKTLQVRLDDTFEDFIVTGVAENVPGNSTIQFDFLLPFDRLLDTEEYAGMPEVETSWNYITVYTYVLMTENSSVTSASAKMRDFYHQYFPPRTTSSDTRVRTFGFKPISDIHLSNYSKPEYSYILSGIAFAILIIACINFMTLAIGRSSGRSKEVSIRKVVGAQRRQLVAQFWGEAILMSVFALIVAMLLTTYFLPVFNTMADKELQFDLTRDWTTIAGLVIIVLFAGLVGGSYPALVLSRFRPIEALQNRLRLSGSNAFTKSLVVVQFSVSVFLIIGTFVMWSQLEYTKNLDPGFNKDQVVVIPVSGLDPAYVADQYRTQVGNHTNIEEITTTSNLLGNNSTSGQMITFEDERHLVGIFKIETNYIDFMGIELMSGRNFNPDLATDSTDSIIVNEALVRTFKMDDPIGQTIPDYYADSEPTIIGIVKDHNYQSFYQKIQPMVLTLDPGWDYGYVFVRIRPTNISESIDMLHSTWSTIAPDVPFEYTFLDEHMRTLYESDERWGTIVSYASIFAILIACLGLLGLSALSVQARTKEIGIRKVFGASVSKVAVLVTREFVWLVLTGVIIGTPVAFFVMQNWLENFAFRIDMGIGMFAVTGALTILIAVATVSYHSVKASLADPVDSIHHV